KLRQDSGFNVQPEGSRVSPLHGFPSPEQVPARLPSISSSRCRSFVIISVVAAIIRRTNKILITRRFDDVHLPGYWEFPGGKVEANESLESALEREIREELAVNIRVEDEYFTTEHTYPSRTV